MDDQLLFTKLSSLPEELKSEAADFIDFLLEKVKKRKPEIKSERQFGSGKDFFVLKPGWDDPLDEEFKDYM